MPVQASERKHLEEQGTFTADQDCHKVLSHKKPTLRHAFTITLTLTPNLNGNTRKWNHLNKLHWQHPADKAHSCVLDTGCDPLPTADGYGPSAAMQSQDLQKGWKLRLRWCLMSS